MLTTPTSGGTLPVNKLHYMQSITHTSFSWLSHKPKTIVILLVKLRTGSFSPCLQASSLNPPLEQIHCPVSSLAGSSARFCAQLLVARHLPARPNTRIFNDLFGHDQAQLSWLQHLAFCNASLTRPETLNAIDARDSYISTNPNTMRKIGLYRARVGGRIFGDP